MRPQSGETENARSSSHCRGRRRRVLEERSRRIAVFLSVTLCLLHPSSGAGGFNLTALGQPISRSS